MVGEGMTCQEADGRRNKKKGKTKRVWETKTKKKISKGGGGVLFCL